MKWIAIWILSSISFKAQSQTDVLNDWYFIGTEKLTHFRFSDDAISWNEETFLFKFKEGKKWNNRIVKKCLVNDLIGLVYKNEDIVIDTSNGDKREGYYTVIILQQKKKTNTLDMLLECSDHRFKDTLNVQVVVNSCDVSSKIRMKFYSKDTIDKYRLLKSVNSISKDHLKKINQLFSDNVKALINKYGENKLLWLAPILFQQTLTELLVRFGYNPMLTEKQANDLFSFFYY